MYSVYRRRNAKVLAAARAGPHASIVRFLDVAVRAALDLAQPAHLLRSYISHGLTWRGRCRPRV